MKKVYPIKASVLMLAYNQRPYIDEAIRSVVLQDTTFDFELIVSDDASTDGTADRCLWWQQRYPDRIRVIRGDSNVGLAANFVRTYQAARGEYIAICEADDFWTDRHKLQIQV
ncbi:glycosyltransferase, partial [Salmonella enterica subsp. enterica serovar Lubbock]